MQLFGENMCFTAVYERDHLDVLVPFDHAIDKFERALSYFSCIPILGIGSGVLQAAFGIIQMVGAIAIGILFLPFVFFNDAAVLCYHAWTHVPHGLGNILVGVLEAIPGIGYLLYHIKEKSKESREEDGMRAGVLNRVDKFYPYLLVDDRFL